MLFNEKLKTLREARGLTQAQLAERAHLSRAAISLYESGARRVAYDDAPMLAAALGVEKSVFDQEDLWREYQQALEQAKAILLGTVNSAASTPSQAAASTRDNAPDIDGERGSGERITIIAAATRRVLVPA